MADIALNAVNPVAPPPQKGSPEQASAPDSNSFASVLKERSAASPSPSPSPSAPARQASNAAGAAHAKKDANRAQAGQDTPAPEASPGTDSTQVDAMLAALLGQSGDGTDAPQTDLPLADSDSDALALDPALAPNPSALPLDPTQAAANPVASPLDPAQQAASPIALPIAAPASPAVPAASLAASKGSTATAPDLMPAEQNAGSAGQPQTPGTATTPVGNAPVKDPGAILGDQDPSQRSSVTLKDNAFGDALAAAQRGAGQTAAQQTNNAPPTQATHAAELPQHVVRTPVGSAGWTDEVGQRIGWIANRDSGRAELVLTPPSMGRVEVSINMNGDQASASFVAANPAAREALQDALPRLREMLAQTGIQLTQADVGAGQQGQSQANGQQGQGGHNRSNGFAALDGMDGAESLAANSTLGRIQSGRGLVDIFA